MSDNGGITLKNIWLFLNAGLLFTAIFSWLLGAENILGVCGILIMLLSFPCNLLVGWVFFAFGNFAEFPFLTLLMLFAFSVIGYLQWFQLVPRVVKFISRNVSANEKSRQLAEADPDTINVDEWRAQQYYDERQRTPVERIIEE